MAIQGGRLKHVIIVGDGMSGYPLEELGGKTPLQVADKPNMDRIASSGWSGLLRNVPKGMRPDSDVAMMSIMGYDPRKCYPGRGPLEAAGMGVELEENDVAFRCNLITEREGIIEDYSAGHVSTGEAEELFKVIKKNYGDIGNFYVGVDYRHLFILRNPAEEVDKLETTPPHKVTGEKFKENLVEPRTLELAGTLNGMILSSREVLSDHPVNAERKEAGKNPANSIWIWGQGRKPELESIRENYGVEGAVISAVTLVKGLGVCAGMDKLDVPGATGYYDTSYENKAKYGLEALEDHDLVLVHVEAPDEAGHAGDIEKKIEAIENLDQRLVKKVVDSVGDEFTISIMADHPTPIDVENHVSDPVPFAVYSSEGRKDEVERFDESSASEGSGGTMKGHKLLNRIIQP